jgi:hypothetical protein
MQSMAGTLRAFVAVTLASQVLAFAACREAGNGNPARATSVREEAEAPTPVLEGVAAEFRRLELLGVQATFRVAYRIETDEGVRTVVVYNRPPQTRIESSEPDGTRSVLIDRGSGAPAIACTADASAGAWQCTEVERVGDSLLEAGLAFFLDPAVLTSFRVEEIGGRAIAGQETRCFRLTAPAPQGTDAPDDVLEHCMTERGVILYSAPLFGTVRATEFSTTVSGEDFAPPAPVH